MPLKRRIKQLEEVDEKDRGYYVKIDDGYALDLDDTTLERALEGERRARAEAVKKAQSLEERFKDIDPDKAREAQERLNVLEEEQLKSEKKFEELAEKRYARAKEAIEAEKAALAAELEKERSGRTAAEKERAELIVRQQLENTLLHMGADPLGLGYAVSLHLPKWSLGEDNKTPVQREGDRVLPGIKDPQRPLTMEEDLSVWQKEDKFAQKFFLPSTGGGARGGVSGGNGSAVVLSREDARDHNKFTAAKQQAEKAGVPLQVANN